MRTVTPQPNTRSFAPSRSLVVVPFSTSRNGSPVSSAAIKFSNRLDCRDQARKQSVSSLCQVVPQASKASQVVNGSKEDPRTLLLLIQRAPNWRALKKLHYERVCISHPLLSATVLCKLPSLVLPVHPLLTDPDIREIQGFVAFLVNEVDNSVLKKAGNTKVAVEERTKLSGLMVKCLYALSLLDLPDCPKPEWIPRLCAAVLDCSDTLGSADVASCIRAVSQLPGLDPTHGDVRALADLGLRALQLELPNLSLQHTAWLLLGLAGLRRTVPQKVLQQALQHASLQVQAAKQGVARDDVDMRWGQEEEQAGVLLQSLCDLFTAMVQLKQRPSASVIAALSQGTERLLQVNTAAAAPALLSALVELQHKPSPAWMQQYFNATQGQLAGMKGRLLAAQAQAVVLVGESPPTSWLSKLSATVSTRAQLLNLEDLASCCSCLQHFEYQPLPAQLGNIIAALPDPALLGTEQLICVMQIYACCGVRPKEAIAEKLEAATKQLLNNLTLDQFSRLIITLNRPGWSSAQKLLDSFTPRSGRLLKTATAAQVVNYLKALKAASYVCWDKTQLLPFVNRLYQVVSDLSPLQCLDVLDGVTAIYLWPYTDIIPAESATTSSSTLQAQLAYQGPVRAIPAGSAVVEPVPWLFAILDKIQQAGEALPAERCAALLTSLRLLASSRYTAEVKRASRTLLPVLQKLLLGNLQTISNTPDVCGLYLSFSLLGHNPSSQLTSQWTAVVSQLIPSMTPADAFLVVSGISRMPKASHAAHGPLVDKVVTATILKVEDAPQDVVEVLSLSAALTSAGSLPWMTDTALMDFVMQKLKQRWDKLAPEVLAKAIKVFATLGSQVPGAVLQLHANAMYQKVSKASVPDVMDVVWSYKRLGFPLKSSQKDKLLVALADASTKLLQGCAAAPLIASMQELYQRGMGELSQWMPALETAMGRDLSEMRVQDVVAAMVLMDEEGHCPPAAMTQRIAVVLDGLVIPEHTRLAEDAVRIFATWRHSVGQRPWLQSLSLHQAAGPLQAASPATATNWLWQYQRARFTPPDAWFAAMFSIIYPQCSELDAENSVKLVESLYHMGSLNRLSMVQRQVLLDAVWGRFMGTFKEVATTGDVDYFCGMMHWMGMVGYQPDADGRDWLNDRLKQQKKLLPFYSTQQLVWLLGSLAPLGNTNTFMAQELRSAFTSRMVSVSDPITPRLLSSGLAACAAAPGPLANKLVQQITSLVKGDWQLGSSTPGVMCLPELVWSLAAVKGTMDNGQLRQVCEKVAGHASELDPTQRYQLVAGLSQLAGASLWSSDVCGAAATGKLLDSLCSLDLLQPPKYSPSEMVTWLHCLQQLGYTPGTKVLDAVMEYLTLIDPLAREVGQLLSIPPSPHISHLSDQERQLLMSTLANFGYDATAAMKQTGSTTGAGQSPNSSNSSQRIVATSATFQVATQPPQMLQTREQTPPAVAGNNTRSPDKQAMLATPQSGKQQRGVEAGKARIKKQQNSPTAETASQPKNSVKPNNESNTARQTTGRNGASAKRRGRKAAPSGTPSNQSNDQSRGAQLHAEESAAVKREGVGKTVPLAEKNKREQSAAQLPGGESAAVKRQDAGKNVPLAEKDKREQSAAQLPGGESAADQQQDARQGEGAPRTLWSVLTSIPALVTSRNAKRS